MIPLVPNISNIAFAVVLVVCPTTIVFPVPPVTSAIGVVVSPIVPVEVNLTIVLVFLLLRLRFLKYLLYLKFH